MYGHNLVAVYDSLSIAERVRDRLVSEGFSASDIRVSSSSEPQTQTTTMSGAEEPGFWSWLFGDVPDTDREVYASHFSQNRAVVSVRVVNELLHQKALDIMEEFNPIDVGDRSASGFVSPSVSGSQGVATSATTTASQPGAQREQVIPVVREELSVGKRATERRYRVKSYVIEKPVEQQVRLRDERVEIERRPVTGAAAGAAAPQERTVEVVERHEEPVVEKHGRTVEEVVVRKEVTERPETVRGTVRETKVDVDKEPAPAGATPTPRR